jgi:hypothetical protein
MLTFFFSMEAERWASGAAGSRRLHAFDTY